MRTITTAVLGSLLLTAGVHAETFGGGDVRSEIAVSQTFLDCRDGELQRAERDNDIPSVNGLATCIVQERTRWERRMNAAYAALQPLLPKQDQAALRQFQRLWKADRDETCEDMDDGEHGQLGVFIVLECTLRQTAIRAVDLEQRVAKRRPQ